MKVFQLIFIISLLKCSLADNKNFGNKLEEVFLSNFTKFDYNKITNLIVFG